MFREELFVLQENRLAIHPKVTSIYGSLMWQSDGVLSWIEALP